MLGLHPSSMSRPAPVSDYSSGPTERRFSPYQENHGSVVAVAGEDFAVIASDTRLSGGHGYNILTRDQSKLFQVRKQREREIFWGPDNKTSLIPQVSDIFFR